jgi:tetratricopeptide (TPR) repeat protein
MWYQNAALLTIIALLVNAFFDFPHQTVAHMIVFFVSLGIVNASVKPTCKIVNKYVIFLFAILFISSSFVVFYRIQGEYYSAMIIRNKKVNARISKLYCNQAVSVLYNTNAFGMPINWYYGNILAKNGEISDAKKAFEAAQKVAPYNRFVMQDLATAWHILGNDKKAIEMYSKALEISPKYDDARYNYSAILIKQNQYDSAVSVLKNIVDTTNTRYSAMATYLHSKIKSN